jgi:hypothetical protein
MVACACHPSYIGSIGGRITVQDSPGRNVRPYFKNNQSKGCGGMTQVVECLPSKPEDLSSNLSFGKKKKKVRKHHSITSEISDIIRL